MIRAPSTGPEPAGDGRAPQDAGHELTLFISGASDLSTRAIAAARQLCDVHLDRQYRLSVIDVHDDPAAVLGNHVLATPTLLKVQPPPTRRYVGDLAQTDKVLLALGLPAATEPPAHGEDERAATSL